MAEFEVPEIFEQYVGDEEITGAFASDPDDFEIEAMRKARAQFIVNGVAQELFDRNASLEGTGSWLEDELRAVRTEQQIIQRALRNEPHMREVPLFLQDNPKFAEVIEAIGGVLPPDPLEAKNLFVGLGPFTIQRPLNEHKQPDLRSWSEDIKPQLTGRFGKGHKLSNSLTRVSRTVDRYFQNQRFLQDSPLYRDQIVQDIETIPGKILTADPLVTSFRVARPAEFYDTVIGFGNVGPKMLLALRVIAQLQSEIIPPQSEVA